MKPKTLFLIKKLPWVVAFVCGVNIQPLYANPTGGQVVSGSAAIATQGNTLTVTTSTAKSIIDWQTFSIDSNEVTRFVQPSSTSSVLNRVLANEPSVLLGTLQSNGQVFLINPYGILVGQGAHIDVAGFVASTLNLSNQDFLDGRFNFTATAGAGAVKNAGTITTPEGGQVYLVAPEVENSGLIQSPGGQVILAAGQTVQLVDTGTPGVTVEITGSDTHATNLGQILADAGTIGMAGALVRNAGTLDAGSVVREGGRIFLKAGQDATLDAGSMTIANGTSGGSVEIDANGMTQVAGTIEANGTSGTGGNVQVLGNLVLLDDGAKVSANGDTGGGTVLVGGDYRGGNPEIHNASRTFVASTAKIEANAETTGNGGKLIVWGNDAAWVYGSLSATGGSLAGNGGFIETSGHYLDVNGIQVNATALNGSGGKWLIDPYNIIIQDAGPDSGINTTISGNTFFDPVADSAILTTATIEAQLNAGTSVTIDTDNGGTQAGDITINGAINKTAGGNANLDFFADNDINVNADITSSAGQLNINFNTDWDDDSFGDLNLGNTILDANGGSIDFSSGDSSPTNVVGTTTIKSTFNGDDFIVKSTGNLTLTDADNFSVSAFSNFGTVNVNAGSLQLEDGGSSSGTFNLAAGTDINTNGTAYTLNGGAKISGSGVFEINGTTVTVSGGTVAINNVDINGGTLSVAGSGSLTLGSTADIDSTGTLTNAGTLTNNGTLNNNAGGTLSSTGSLFNNGTLNSDLILASGFFGGKGILNGDLTNTGGIVAPGTSPGVMTITGNYVQGSAGTLNIELGGYTAGSGYDQLAVTGTATLAGILNISLFGGFAPVTGSSFANVITAGGGITGTFQTTNVPTNYVFSPLYSGSHFDLQLLASPNSPVAGGLFGQPVTSTQTAGGPFAGVTYPNPGGIAGNSQDPAVLGGIDDLFIPADSPFTAGVFDQRGSEGGFYFDQPIGGRDDFQVASHVPFPLFYAESRDTETGELDPNRYRRPFGMCSVGGL